MRWINFIFIIAITSLLSACEPDYFPKPKGYNRIDLPSHSYVQLKEEHPFTFQHSIYAKIEPHQSSLSEPHWLDIKYPSLNASVELTYKEISSKKNKLDELIVDSHKLKSKHNVKAYAIDEAVVVTPKGYTAVIFELEGEVPSQFQFYITDSINHFMRGALYFPVATKNDSLSPIIDFIKIDMIHMLNSLEWVEK
jgi:gliding motility-associated lipoprotein GldD